MLNALGTMGFILIIKFFMCMWCLFHKEYDAIARLGIDNPQEYLSRRYGNQTKLLKLETCCVGHLVQTRVEAALEEVQGSNGWVDIMVCSLFAI